MRTVIELRGDRTAIEGGEVSGPDRVTNSILTMMYRESTGYVPDRDLMIASLFADRHGARIVEHDEDISEVTEDHIVY